MENKEDVMPTPKTHWLLMLNILVLAIIAPIALLIIFIEVAKEPAQQPAPVVAEKAVSEDQKRMSPEQKAMAKAWLVELKKAKEDTQNASILGDVAKHSNVLQKLFQLSGQANTLFYGQELSECSVAVDSIATYWKLMTNMATPYGEEVATSHPLSIIALSSVAGLSWQAGQHYINCQKIIDNLK